MIWATWWKISVQYQECGTNSSISYKHQKQDLNGCDLQIGDSNTIVEISLVFPSKMCSMDRLCDNFTRNSIVFPEVFHVEPFWDAVRKSLRPRQSTCPRLTGQLWEPLLIPQAWAPSILRFYDIYDHAPQSNCNFEASPIFPIFRLTHMAIGQIPVFEH